jgi:hypothetical protein
MEEENSVLTGSPWDRTKPQGSHSCSWLLLARSVVVWEQFHSAHGEPMGTEFPSSISFLLPNPKFSASRLLGLPTCFHACILLVLFDPEDRGDLPPETSLDFERTTRRYIPEDSIRHNHRCVNLKSYM